MNRGYRAFVSLLTAAFVLLQHFQVSKIGEYPITLGLFLGVLLVASVSTRLAMISVFVTLSIAVIPNALVQIAAPSTRDGALSFFQTLALFVFAAVVIGQCKRGTVRPQAVVAMRRGVFFALIIVVGLCLLQVATGARGSVQWFNPFGGHQYLYEYDPHLEFNPIPRAAGFYLEPSYAAFVIGSLSVALLAQGYRKVPVWVLAGAGLLAVRSATGLILFGVVALVVILVGKSRVKLVALVVLAVLTSLALPYLIGRLDSTFTAGSSAYYRLIGPLQILKDTLLHFPLGHPYGSLRNTVADYGILNGAAAGDSLDNGFYVIVFYFGWLGLVASICLVSWALVSLTRGVRAGSVAQAIVPIWAVGSLLFSGGIMLPEYVFTLWVIFATRQQSRTLIPEESGSPLASKAVDSHGDVPGRRRVGTDSRFARQPAQGVRPRL
jgi:putative colanic acid polymerase